MVSKPENACKPEKKPKEPSVMGRPEYVPNEKHELVVRALCLFGATHKWIANYLGMTDKTLRKHYKDLLDNCAADKHNAAESALFVQVIRGNMDAIKFFMEKQHPMYKKGYEGNEADQSKADFLAKIADVLKNAH